MATQKKRKGMQRGSRSSHRGASRKRGGTIESGGRSAGMESGERT
jgi:hypothetical protein